VAFLSFFFSHESNKAILILRCNRGAGTERQQEKRSVGEEVAVGKKIRGRVNFQKKKLANEAAGVVFFAKKNSMSDLVKGLKEGEVYSMSELLRMLQGPDFSVNVPFGPSMQTVSKMLPATKDICDLPHEGDLVLRMGREPLTEANLKRAAVYPRGRNYLIMVSGSPKVIKNLGIQPSYKSSHGNEPGQGTDDEEKQRVVDRQRLESACHLDSFFGSFPDDNVEEAKGEEGGEGEKGGQQRLTTRQALVAWLRSQPCTLEVGEEGEHVLLTCKQPGIIPATLRFLCSSLFLDGSTPHIVPSGPPVYCSRDCTVRQPVERVKCPVSFLEASVLELPLVLHRMHPQKKIMNEKTNRLTPKGAYFVREVVNDLVIALLHTLALLQEQMGVVLYPEDLLCIKMQCQPGMAKETPYFGKEPWYNPDRVCYPFALVPGDKKSTVAFEVPYPRFLWKFILPDNVTAYEYPMEQGSAKATIISATNVSSTFVTHQFLASVHQMAQQNASVEQIVERLQARGVQWSQEQLEALAKWAVAGYLAPYLRLHEKEQQRLREVGVLPGDAKYYGYDMQRFCYQLARQMNRWNLQAGLASTILQTGTVLDYLNLRLGYQPSITDGPSQAAGIWKDRPIVILRDLYLRARQPVATPSLAIRPSSRPTSTTEAAEDEAMRRYVQTVNQQPLFKYLGSRISDCKIKLDSRILRCASVME
jgi:hypothetical protein